MLSTFFTKMERGTGPTNRQVENYVFIHLIDYEPAVGVKFCRQVLEKCTRRRQRTVSMIFRLFGKQTSLDNVAWNLKSGNFGTMEFEDFRDFLAELWKFGIVVKHSRFIQKKCRLHEFSSETVLKWAILT